ncbi:MAG: hypothetical protein V4687_08290 [Bacteroidota bacterium]
MSGILITALFFSPYILVPFIMARAFRIYAIEPKWLTYLFTAIFLLIYPDLMFWISLLFKEPLKDGRGMCFFPPVLMNVPLLPLALIVQWGFNRYFNSISTQDDLPQPGEGI